VSKLNGRTIIVAGNSFITSTKTISAAVNRLPHINGACTRRKVCHGVQPSTRAAWSMLTRILPKLESTALKAMARKRTR
jgi:hypothetical protein